MILYTLKTFLVRSDLIIILVLTVALHLPHFKSIIYSNLDPSSKFRLHLDTITVFRCRIENILIQNLDVADLMQNLAYDLRRLLSACECTYLFFLFFVVALTNMYFLH